MLFTDLPPTEPLMVRYVDSTPQVYDVYPLNFRVPLIVGGFLGAGVVSGLILSVTAETNRLSQQDETLKIPLDKPDVDASNGAASLKEPVAVPSSPEDTPRNPQQAGDSITVPHTPTLDLQHYRNIGTQIIAGFAVSERSQMIVAPSRCGKTTVMYFLLEEFFKRYPQMQCWVWQGKQIEPVHPNIPREQHTLFQMGEADLTAVDAVYHIYKARQTGDNDRTPTKLIVTDWQSIRDGLKASEPEKLKDVRAKIMTIANNGAALNVNVVGDTQSANIDDWDLGSGSLRDNFDIYGVSRIAWVDGYAKGDIKALPKLIGNKDIIPSVKDREEMLTNFEQLRTAMEQGLINTSILLSTVGICRLGITPEFERKNLVWGGYDRHKPNSFDLFPTVIPEHKLSENAQNLYDFMNRTHRIKASVSDIQPNFKVKGQRFTVDEIKSFFDELIQAELATRNLDGDIELIN